MSASNYLELEILDHALGGNTAGNVFTPPANVYISLHSADPGETGASELSGSAYARVTVPNTTANWSAAAAGSKANAAAFTFPTASGAWTAATHFGIWDASTVGNFLFGGALGASKTVGSGDTASFAIGALTITAD